MPYREPDPPPPRCPGFDELGCGNLIPPNYGLCVECYGVACDIDFGKPTWTPPRWILWLEAASNWIFRRRR